MAGYKLSPEQRAKLESQRVMMLKAMTKAEEIERQGEEEAMGITGKVACYLPTLEDDEEE